MSIIAKAFDTKDPKKKLFRLTNMQVREVSLVDKPANGHPFLLYKSLTGDKKMILKAATLSAGIKQSLLAVLEPAMEQMQNLVDTVSGAKEDDAAGMAVPEDIATLIDELGTSMASIIAQEAEAASAPEEAPVEGETPPADPAMVEAAAPPPPKAESKVPAKIDDAAPPPPKAESKVPAKIDDAAPPPPKAESKVPTKIDDAAPSDVEKGLATLKAFRAPAAAVPITNEGIAKSLFDLMQAVKPATPVAPPRAQAKPFATSNAGSTGNGQRATSLEEDEASVFNKSDLNTY